MPTPNIKIEMLPAGNGDAILLEFSDEVWLVDSGYIKQTYRECLLPRLESMYKNGKSLDRLIITHIDADHISGATALLKDNGDSANPNIIPINEVWHNSYRHIQFEEKVEGELTEEEKSRLLSMTKTNYLKIDTSDSGRKVSGAQGSSLARYLYDGNYNWNTEFCSKAVSCEDPYTMPLKDDGQLTLLTPNTKALANLGKKWKRELMKKGYADELNEDQYFDDALEFLLAGEASPRLEGKKVSASSRWIDNIINNRSAYKEDSSATNESSISFLLEQGGKKVLMLGDAFPSQVIQQLKKICENRNIEFSKDNPFKVDVLKLSHHGGFSNNSPDLFELVVADHYLISTNGRRHYHPHLETLAWLIHSHQNHHKKILFNYNLNLDQKANSNPHQKRLKKIMDKALWEKYNYEVVLPVKDGFQELAI